MHVTVAQSLDCGVLDVRRRVMEGAAEFKMNEVNARGSQRCSLLEHAETLGRGLRNPPRKTCHLIIPVLVYLDPG
jgi:hypothetical protein